jgi:NTP pyrophosphatase (non-canonical NTP hydrolase)
MKYRRMEYVDGREQMIVATKEEIDREAGLLPGHNAFNADFILDGWEEFSDETFNNYQQATAQTAKYPPDQALEYLSLGIASEAGEVAGKMKKWIRDGDSKMTREEWVQAMSSEIGDVLWYSARLADELGLSLSQIAEDNMDKLLDRKARGVIGGSGDNR